MARNLRIARHPWRALRLGAPCAGWPGHAAGWRAQLILVARATAAQPTFHGDAALGPQQRGRRVVPGPCPTRNRCRVSVQGHAQGTKKRDHQTGHRASLRRQVTVPSAGGCAAFQQCGLPKEPWRSMPAAGSVGRCGPVRRESSARKAYCQPSTVRERTTPCV